MRALLALLLSVILAVASQGEAVARSEMAGASDLVLCAQSGASTVTLDANGHPVHARACTHCLAAGVVADLPSRADVAAPASRVVRLRPPVIAAQAFQAAISPTARAPPGILV